MRRSGCIFFIMFIKSILIPEKGRPTIILSADDFSGEEELILSRSELRRLSGEICESAPVTEELYDRLKSATVRTSVVVESISILQNSAKSRRELSRLLKQKNFSEESVKYALKYVTAKGYLDEKRDCVSKAERLLRQNHYGPQRISTYLFTHGYVSSSIKFAVSQLDEEEIHAALLYNIERKFPNISEFDKNQRDKAVTSLIRLGFSSSMIFSEIHNLAVSSNEE